MVFTRPLAIAMCSKFTAVCGARAAWVVVKSRIADWSHSAGHPMCECGAGLRPDIVWFGEALPEDTWQAAAIAAFECDLFLVVGTSAVVHPAASLVPIAKRGQPSANVIEINLAKTEASALADVGLYGPSGVVLPKLVEMLG